MYSQQDLPSIKRGLLYERTPTVRVCGHIWMEHTWRPEVNLESPPLSPPTFFFKAESFTELGALLLAKLIGSKYQGSPIPASLELKTHTNTPRFLTWVLRIELRSPFLHSKHFPNSATFPAPRWGLLSDTVSKSSLNTPTFPLLLIKPKTLFCWQYQLLPSFQFFYSDESKLKVCSEFRAP